MPENDSKHCYLHSEYKMLEGVDPDVLLDLYCQIQQFLERCCHNHHLVSQVVFAIRGFLGHCGDDVLISDIESDSLVMSVPWRHQAKNSRPR